MSDLFAEHCRTAVQRLMESGRYSPEHRFEVGPGLGYGESWFGVWYGGKVWTNSGLRTRGDAQRYADGYNSALDDAA